MRFATPFSNVRLLRLVASAVTSVVVVSVLPGVQAQASLADPDGTISIAVAPSADSFENVSLIGWGPGGTVIEQTRHDGLAVQPAAHFWVRPDGSAKELPPNVPLGDWRHFVTGSVLTGEDLDSNTVIRYDLQAGGPLEGNGLPKTTSSYRVIGATDSGWIEGADTHPGEYWGLTLRRPGQADAIIAPTADRASVALPRARGTDVYWAEPANAPRVIWRLDTITGEISTVADSADRTIVRLFITPNTVSWVDSTGQSAQITRRLCRTSRTGATQPTCVVSDDYVSQTMHGVSDTQTFWDEPDPADSTMRRFLVAPVDSPDDSTVVTLDGVPLRNSYYGSVEWFDGLLTVNPDRDTINVIGSDSASAVQLFKGSPRQSDVIALAVSADRLVGADSSDVASAGSTPARADNAYPAWQRRISSRSPLTVSDRAAFAPSVYRATEGSAIALSGSRTVRLDADPGSSGCRLVLGDEGRASVNDSAARCDPPAVSGPYYVRTRSTESGVEAEIATTDRRTIAKLGCSAPGSYDLFGSRAAWVGTDGTLLVRDLAKPAGPTNPQVLATGYPCESRPRVSLWGNRVAVALDGRARLFDLGTGAVRYLDNVATPQVGEGVMVWRGQVDSTLYALDLTIGGSSPVPLGQTSAEPRAPYAVGDHEVVWQDAATGAIKLAPLPFGQESPHAPRLLGTVASTVLATKASGEVSPWHAEFDATKPLSSWRLDLRNPAGAVVRTWTGTAPLGGIRLDWDGKVGGRWAPGGKYTWTMSGVAADGEGTLRNLDGAAVPIQGQLVVRDARVRDLKSDRLPDLIAKDAVGDLYRFDGTSPSGFGSRTRIGVGWGIYSAIASAGDLSGDGRPDIVARDRAGYLWRYDGNGLGGVKPRARIGTGWNSMTAILGVGDLSGDGRGDLIARDYTGNLWRYDSYGSGALKPRVKVGTGWNSLNAIVGVGDLTSDGRPDLLARDATGVLWRYEGTNTGTLRTRVKAGSGWTGYTNLVGLGDADGDGQSDLFARDSAGTVWRYPGNGKGAFLPRVSLGTGWRTYPNLY